MASTNVSPNASPFRRRTIGRAASPPTWACYEQIRDYGYSDDDSEEDDDDEASADEGSRSDSASGEDDDDAAEVEPAGDHVGAGVDEGIVVDMEMDVDAPGNHPDAHSSPPPTPAPAVTAKAKGKQRAVDPEPPTPKRHTRKGKRERERVYTLRPILSIQRSQGFVWNQDLFVPPYAKDRYIASTSPPSGGFISTSVSSTNSALTDYEVEVVEIRVQEGEFEGILP
ncbi:hypothetical protein MKEN_00305300 [Mycena kentingensis (nom. inval.)]|nr:hypothetical protein MKEN_00305300 [Mycena kentingensis (nom. inval.)]